jgi:hypothetical protein
MNPREFVRVANVDEDRSLRDVELGFLRADGLGHLVTPNDLPGEPKSGIAFYFN